MRQIQLKINNHLGKRGYFKCSYEKPLPYHYNHKTREPNKTAKF